MLYYLMRVNSVVRAQGPARTACIGRDAAVETLLPRPRHATTPTYSVRVSRDYRAVSVQAEDEMVRFWIGSHADYLRILSSL